MGRCIYRNIDVDECCKNYQEDGSDYCREHMYIKNPVFEYISQTVDIDKKINLSDIIAMYTIMFITGVVDRVSIIKSLFGKKNKTIRYAIQYGLYTTSKSTKKMLIERMLRKMEWHATVCTLSNFERKLVMVQRCWRRYMDRLSGTCYGTSINAEDIFSFEKIEEIDHPFTLVDRVDKNDYVYTFDVINLAYHVQINGGINPYTKRMIDSEDMNRMYHYMYIKDIYVDDDEFQWYSVSHAYTDLSLKMDSLGYYTDVKWFLSLRYTNLLNVLNTFHTYGCVEDYMIDDNFDNVYPDYVFRFCKMAIEMLSDVHDASTYGFLLYKSLADSSTVFHNNCPNWVL